MANSESHRLGELIGDIFEEFIIRYIKGNINDQTFYVDYQHPRPTRGNKPIIEKKDSSGNNHRLDIVIEEGGSETFEGSPRAFIEVAWRRYTKHSKNKVQEIFGAIKPLLEAYMDKAPFYATVLAGDFTESSLRQLRSEGFYVLHITYETLNESFESIGLSIIWDESTSETVCAGLYDQINQMAPGERENLYRDFIARNSSKLEKLTLAIKASLTRYIKSVMITPVHGKVTASYSIEEACRFIDAYDENEGGIPIQYYEVTIKYNTDESIQYQGASKVNAIQFLNRFR